MNRFEKKRRKRGPFLCRCNEVSVETVKSAIIGGAQTANEVFDRTTAGVGPCGGSCRPKIDELLIVCKKKVNRT